MLWLRHFVLLLIFVTAQLRPPAARAFVSAVDAGSQPRVGVFETGLRGSVRLVIDEASAFGGGLNFYDYAGGDPVNRIDVNGEWVFLLPLVVGAVEGIGMGFGIRAMLHLAAGGSVYDCISTENLARDIATDAFLGAATAGLGVIAADGARAAAGSRGLGGACRGGACVSFSGGKGRWFWSGRDPARLTALRLAEESGGWTLEMSPAGSVLQEGLLTRQQAAPLWKSLSADYANGARGRVDVALGGVYPDSTWTTLERRLLMENGNAIRVHLSIVE
jgi:hypothetical protein